MTERRLGPRAVLASGVFLGLAQLAYYLLARPAAVGLDFRVYHVAARTAVAGGDIYAVSPADGEFTFQQFRGGTPGLKERGASKMSEARSE